ncbi:MAG: hypothetical protein WCF61_05625 [Terriglobales bacterium]
MTTTSLYVPIADAIKRWRDRQADTAYARQHGLDTTGAVTWQERQVPVAKHRKEATKEKSLQPVG